MLSDGNAGLEVFCLPHNNYARNSNMKIKIIKIKKYKKKADQNYFILAKQKRKGRKNWTFSSNQIMQQ